MCIVFDAAQREVVWFGQMRWAGSPGTPAIPYGIWHWKPPCLVSSISLLTINMHNDGGSNPLIWHRYPCRFSGQCFSSKAISCFADATWPSRSCSTRPLPLRLCEKHCAQIWPANIHNLTEWIREHIPGITKEVPQCVMTPFPLWLHKCIEWSDGHLQNAKLKQ